MMTIVALAATLLVQGRLQPPNSCPSPRTTASANAFLELAEKVGPRDTVAAVRVCITLRDPKQLVGSYHGLLTYDSSAARLIRVEKGRQGMRVENTRRAGVIDFAGAFSGGFSQTLALTVHLALAKPGKIPPLRLHMYELNESGGTVLTSMVRVTGYPASLRTTPGPLKSDSARKARGAS